MSRGCEAGMVPLVMSDCVKEFDGGVLYIELQNYGEYSHHSGRMYPESASRVTDFGA